MPRTDVGHRGTASHGDEDREERQVRLIVAVRSHAAPRLSAVPCRPKAGGTFTADAAAPRRNQRWRDGLGVCPAWSAAILCCVDRRAALPHIRDTPRDDAGVGSFLPHPPQRLPPRPLRRVPGRALPSSPRGAGGRVLHPRRIEGRPPSLLVVPRELEIVALTRHADCDVPDAGPRVQPRAESPEGAIIGGAREPGESEGCS